VDQGTQHEEMKVVREKMKIGCHNSDMAIQKEKPTNLLELIRP